MQLSTTTIASRVDPSSRTTHLARIGSLSRVALVLQEAAVDEDRERRRRDVDRTSARAEDASVSAGFALAGWPGRVTSDGHARLESSEHKNSKDDDASHGGLGQGMISIRFDAQLSQPRGQAIGALGLLFGELGLLVGALACSSARWRSALRCLTNSA